MTNDLLISRNCLTQSFKLTKKKEMKKAIKQHSPSWLGCFYTWNANSTLATYPYPGYTRKLSYDEEGRLTKISRQTSTSTTPVFEYGYGFDGNRRWRKNLAGNTWDWYPCGVACCAGELVTMRSTNGGASWSASKLSISEQGVSIKNGSVALASLPGGDIFVVAGSSTTRIRMDQTGPRSPSSTSTAECTNSIGDYDEYTPIPAYSAAQATGKCSDILNLDPTMKKYKECMRKAKTQKEKDACIKAGGKHIEDLLIKYAICQAASRDWGYPGYNPCDYPGVGESCYHCCMLEMSYGYHKALIRKKGMADKVNSGWINYADTIGCVAKCG
jgi:hypothetical protein